jgi:hypothetical protein
MTCRRGMHEEPMLTSVNGCNLKTGINVRVTSSHQSNGKAKMNMSQEMPLFCVAALFSRVSVHATF